MVLWFAASGFAHTDRVVAADFQPDSPVRNNPALIEQFVRKLSAISSVA